jgi:hypothetical protein
VSTHEAQSEYDVELTACFVFGISTTLVGPSGLGRAEIEEMIEADWMWISLDTNVLLESHWQFESVDERPVPDEER